METLILEVVSTQQQPTVPAVQCWIVWGVSGALTSCRRGYKRSPASFLRPFCKQESHKAPAEAEGDLWETINFSYITEREHSAPSKRVGQAPASLMAAREALGKINMQADGKRCSNPGAEPPLRGWPISGRLYRGVHTKVVIAPSFLQSKTYWSYQNPGRNTADSYAAPLIAHPFRFVFTSAGTQATAELRY